MHKHFCFQDAEELAIDHIQNSALLSNECQGFRTDGYKTPNELSKLEVVLSDFEAFSLDSAIGEFVSFEQVEGDGIGNGEVLCGAPCAFSV
jgi:hypothetical protein